MAGNPPVVTSNAVSASTINPGASATWTVRAQDATARSFVVRRPIEDSQGNRLDLTENFVISDPLNYGDPVCDDPSVTVTVDPTDRGIVRIAVAADA